MAERLPRIALVSFEVYEHGGAERVLVETIQRASGRVRWVVVSRTLPPDLRQLVEWRPAPAPDAPFRARLGGFAATATAQLLRPPRADLIHATGPVVLARPDLVTVHFLRAAFYEAVGADRRPSTRAHLALERWFLGRARALAVPSDQARRDLERRLPGARVLLTPNGVDLDRFRPDAEARTALRGALGVPERRIVALFVGNAWERKGLPAAVEGLGRARRAGADVELWVVGAGDPARYADVVDRVKAGEAVRFLGVRPEVERAYAAADLFVQPSVYETFCLSAYEAAACGLPVVATPVGGVEELVGAGEAGLIIARDGAAVGEALAALAADPDRRRRLGEAGRRRASAFTWDRSVASLLAAYDDLLAPRGRFPRLAG